MYIVQVKSPFQRGWHVLEGTQWEFRSLDKAIAHLRALEISPQLEGHGVRIWSTQSDHVVEL